MAEETVQAVDEGSGQPPAAKAGAFFWKKASIPCSKAPEDKNNSDNCLIEGDMDEVGGLATMESKLEFFKTLEKSSFAIFTGDCTEGLKPRGGLSI